LIFSLPGLLWAYILDKRGSGEKRVRVVHRTTGMWARSLVALSGSRIKVTGEENIPAEGPVLYVSNHQSNFDVPILIGFIDRPKAFMSKVEVVKIPMVSSWMRQMRCVFMDRKDARQSVAAVNEAVQNLKRGYSMVIFPEGTRSGGDEMGEFKAGSFKLAVKSGVPIVPVSISGSYKIMGKKSLIIRPAQVNVHISEPVDVSGLSREELQALPERVKGIIRSALERKSA
jgi:1-acyl-sn-glycerol-3-phosphate acyltransferase